MLQQQRQMGQMPQGQPQFDQRQQIQQLAQQQQRFLQDQSQFNAGQPNGLQSVLAQQQSMHNAPNFFDRPSSTSSVTHSQQFSQHSPQAQQFPQQNSQFQMMPPPPPRPPSSRPGTSQSQMSHRSGTPAAVSPPSPALGNVGQLGGMQRPPSRLRTSSSGFNMFPQGQPISTPKPPTPIQPSHPLQQQPQVHTPTHTVPQFLQQQLQLQQQQQPTPQQHQQQPQVQAPQGFTPVPSTPVPSSPGRKRRLTGQGVLDAQPSSQFGGLGGSGLTGISMNNPGNVGAGGLMAMPQSMGSPNPTLLGGAGGGLMGPPHVVPSRVNSLGGQVSQLPQGLDEGPDFFSQQITTPQTSLPPQVPQTPMMAGTAPFQTHSGVPNVGIGGAGMRQRQVGLGTPGFGDVHAPLQSPVVQRMPQTVVTPAQMQMQMQSADPLTINTGLPEVPGLPVVPDATVPVPLPLPHPPTAPTSATSSATALPTTAAPSSAPMGAKTMRVTLVPPADIKSLTEEEVDKVKGWMARDKEYEAVYRSMKERMAEELRVSRAENSDMWWEVSDRKKLRTKFGITYPGQRFRDNRKRGRREGFRL